LRLVWDLPCFRPFKWTAHGVKPSTGEGRFEDILGPTFERLTPRNGEEERAFVLRKTLGGFRPTKALRPGFSCALQQFVSCFESVANPAYCFGRSGRRGPRLALPGGGDQDRANPGPLLRRALS
jgi:hypothetical protein